MSKKEEKICFLTRSNLWRVPLCSPAFSPPSNGYSYTQGTQSLIKHNLTFVSI